MLNIGVDPGGFLKGLQDLLLSMLSLIGVHLRVMKGHIPVISKPIAVIVLRYWVDTPYNHLALDIGLGIKTVDELVHLGEPTPGARNEGCRLVVKSGLLAKQ